MEILECIYPLSDQIVTEGTERGVGDSEIRETLSLELEKLWRLRVGSSEWGVGGISEMILACVLKNEQNLC